MADKVYGGTPTAGAPLCGSCSYGHVVRGYNFQEATHCNMQAGKLVPFAVRTCSMYEPRSTATLAEMQRIAWVVESRNRGQWGFGGEQRTEIVVRPPNEDEQPATPTTQHG